MKNLLYKELKLAVHPTLYLFLLLSAMLLIPQYPYYVVFLYTCLAIFFTFLTGRESRDVFYTTLLPVRKRDVVRARTFSVALFELAQGLLAIPFAVLSVRINPLPDGNGAGIEANAAFFGLAFLMMGGFNLIFLPGFYRTGDRITRPLLGGGVFLFVYIFVAEALAQYIPSPVSDYLDSSDPAMFVPQLPVLLGGLALWAGLTALACRLSERRFERVDL